MNNLEEKIKIKINELEALKDLYLYYLLEDKNDEDEFAKEKYRETKIKIDLLKELLEGN